MTVPPVLADGRDNLLVHPVPPAYEGVATDVTHVRLFRNLPGINEYQLDLNRGLALPIEEQTGAAT